MVQVDASGSGGLVDPGVACWVGISGALGAREERGMSAWQFAVMKPALSSPSIEAFSALSIRGENGITCRRGGTPLPAGGDDHEEWML